MELYNNKSETDTVCISSKEKYNLYASILMFAYTFIRCTFSLIGINERLSGTIVIIIAYLLLGYSCLSKKATSFKPAIFVVISILFMLFVNQILHPEYGNTIVKGFALQRGLVIIVFICGMFDSKNVNRCIIYSAYFSCIEIIFDLLEYFSNGGYWESYLNGVTRYSAYNMNLGYNASFAVIIFISTIIHDKSKNVFLIMLSVVLVFLSIVFGSRGCLVIYVLFLSVLLFYTKKSNKKNMLILLSICMLTFLFFIGIANIVKFLISMLDQYGFSSRTLNSFIASTDHIDSSGRDSIWSFLLNKISDKPMLGYGIFGDQYLLSSEMGINAFAHNFFIELMISFGVPIGLLLSIILVYECGRTVKQIYETQLGIYFISLVVYNIGNLFVSNTYWYSTRFWVMIALIIWVKYNSYNKSKRKENI